MNGLDCLKESVEVLNGLAWETTPCGVVADVPPDEIAPFGELVFKLGVQHTVFDRPGGYSVVLYKEDAPRLRRLGLRFPGHGELDSAFGSIGNGLTMNAPSIM
jgi:hypothetical protein